ncbi:MAG: Flagellar protein [Thermocaproicibacter melissae]|jgi:flagellar protein FliO/FliZ|uniref:FliO/MopB family protein n=2 Tax=Thermocaproicibacter melissae TaxID=2966552 RepID=UPI0024B23EB6|nr:flagellar biosynthetic protein FliO [Thermocaproicibacter melissae]WBY64327.1 flagellar biosynthetic protein FliO [Thermocaproicibacter melissae]
MKMPYLLSFDSASQLGELILYLLAVVGVLWLCWALSKFLLKRTGAISSTNNIRILERVSIAQDKGLVIAEICGGVYLLSFSNERVEILMELDRHLLKQPKPMAQQSFKDILNSALKGRLDATRFNGKNNNGSDDSKT